MLVEDDNNLREIYEARLAAEGYQIISAPDGEAALALAIKERPDLIISDIMMPKVSGFDMLDILRSTTETKSTKIIMMTALGQAEDKARAEKLGADRYLVKSQVTLEDVVKAAQELLGDQIPSSVSGVAVEQPAAPTPAPAPAATTTSLTGAAPAVPSTTPITITPTDPVAPVAPVTPTPITVTSTPPEQPAAPTPAPAQPVAQPIPITIVPETPAPATPVTPAGPTRQIVTAPPSTTEPATSTTGEASSEDKPSGERVIVKSDSPSKSTTDTEELSVLAAQRKKVINPISDMSQRGPDLEALMAKEGETLSSETTPAPTPAPAQPATPAPQPSAPAPELSAPITAPNDVIPNSSTTAEEEAELEHKIEQFITTQNPSISTSPINDVTPPPSNPSATPPAATA